jgi:hypothetical protein
MMIIWGVLAPVDSYVETTWRQSPKHNCRRHNNNNNKQGQNLLID